MDLNIVMDSKLADCCRKCNVLTCVHYAGGFCVCCEKEGECEFVEKSSYQD